MSDAVELHDDALYDVDQVRVILSPQKPLARDTVYRMGKRGVLKPTPVGPSGGRTKWSGRVLKAYIHGDAA